MWWTPSQATHSNRPADQRDQQRQPTEHLVGSAGDGAGLTRIGLGDALPEEPKRLGPDGEQQPEQSQPGKDDHFPEVGHAQRPKRNTWPARTPVT